MVERLCRRDIAGNGLDAKIVPDGCVIEIPGYVDRTGIRMPVVGYLPLA